MFLTGTCSAYNIGSMRKTEEEKRDGYFYTRAIISC